MLQPPTQEQQQQEQQPTTSHHEELESADTLVSILPDQPVEETAVIVDTTNSDGVMQATEVDGHKVFYTVENFSHSVTDSKKEDPDEDQRYVVSADNRKRRLPPVASRTVP